MAAEWFLSAVVTALGSTTFCQFEAGAATQRRSLRRGTFSAVTVLLGRTVGWPWTFTWIVGLPMTGATVHL
jgi:hypothetical protein